MYSYFHLSLCHSRPESIRDVECSNRNGYQGQPLNDPAFNRFLIDNFQVCYFHHNQNYWEWTLYNISFFTSPWVKLCHCCLSVSCFIDYKFKYKIWTKPTDPSLSLVYVTSLRQHIAVKNFIFFLVLKSRIFGFNPKTLF